MLITRLRLPPLIVTLGTFSLFRGLAEAITRGVDTFTNFPPTFSGPWAGAPRGIPAPTLAVPRNRQPHLVAGASDDLRPKWRAIGFAEENARHAGIPIERRIAFAYVVAGVVTGLAAVIYTARLGQAKADAGMGYELFAITAWCSAAPASLAESAPCTARCSELQRSQS
jgi:rhamnose transport system permease protein